MSAVPECGAGDISKLRQALAGFCNKQCELGPTVTTLSNGPDATASLFIKTCRSNCEHQLCARVQRADSNDSQFVAFNSERTAAGSPSLITSHYDN